MNTRRAGVRNGGRASWLDLVLAGSASLLLTALTLYLLQLYDVITFTGRADWFGRLPNFLYYHLRSSIFFFAATFAVYAFSLRTLARKLTEHETDVQAGSGAIDHPATGERRQRRLGAILNLDARTEMAITTFFGIGVIYTAIGMESALVTALGGIRGAEEAARQGAWEILRRLVDGGLILALSTTIFGGAGGYLLRMLKHVVIGRRLSELFVSEERESEAHLRRVGDHLARIERLLERSGIGGPPVLEQETENR